MSTNIEQQLQDRTDRVREHSAVIVNRRIDRATQANIQRAVTGGRDSIVRRLAELDREWDVDRALMLNFSLAGAATFASGFARFALPPPWARKRKGLLYLFAAQLGFLAMHASVGWCPPLPVFRRLGFRTRTEIEVERAALVAAMEQSAAA